MLMGAHDGRIEHHVFVVAIFRQYLENTFKNAAFAPAAEPPVNVLPITKSRRKIAPRNARTVAIKHGFNK